MIKTDNSKLTYSLALVCLSFIGCSEFSKSNNTDTSKIVTSPKELLLGFKDQQTSIGEVREVLGKPEKEISFAHTSYLQYLINSERYCIYFDGSGLIKATNKGVCIELESYEPKGSLTSP